MSNHASLTNALRFASLAAALAAGLGLPPRSMAGAGAWQRSDAALPSATPAIPAAPHPVTTCVDDANLQGSLRYEVLHAANNETIDLTPLKFVCSKITLDSVIDVLQDTLVLQGPGAKYLTIDGDHYSRVLKHTGNGTLLVDEITIANGYYIDSNKPYGGCIYSQANISLVASVVSNCTVVSASSIVSARGGGVRAGKSLFMNKSEISDNNAIANYGADAYGGGASAGTLHANYSTIEANATTVSWPKRGRGGGLEVLPNGHSYVANSTISGNRADFAGGLYLQYSVYEGVIVNSTISSNSALDVAGIFSDPPLKLINSTIAFNTSSHPGAGSGLWLNTQATLVSSIVADNMSGDGASDLDGMPNIVLTSINNLVTSSTLPLPLETISACPKLGPLLDNGGPTRTHALARTSPAVDQGSSVLGTLQIDQRLEPRAAGPEVDIGAVELQPGENDERILVSGFDGLCDQ